MNIKKIVDISKKITFLIFWMITGYIAGDSGMGFFFSAFVIYALLYNIFLSAISDTVAKLVSARKSKGFHDNAQKVFHFGVYTSIGIGIVIGGILYLGGAGLMYGLYGYSIPSSIMPFFGLYFFITSIKCCLSGYARGHGFSSYLIISDIAECIILLLGGTLIINNMYKHGIKVSNLLKNQLFSNLDGAIGAIISMCVALGIATAFILVITIMVHNSNNYENGIKGINNKHNFIIAYLKTTLNNSIDKLGIILSLVTLTILYIKAGAGYQADTKDLYTTLGVFAGKYITVIAFPFIFFINYITREKKRIINDYNHDEHSNIRSRSGYVLKNTLYIMLPVTITVIALAKPIVMVFFGGKMAMGVTLVRKGGIVIILAAIACSARTLLNSVGLELYAAASEITGYVCLFIFMLTSVASGLNVNQLIYSLIIYYLIQALVSAFFVYRMLDIYIVDIGIKAAKVIAGTACMAIIEIVIDQALVLNLPLLLACILAGYLTYFIVIGVLKGISEKDVNSIKGTLMYYPTYLIYGFFGER